MGLGVEGPAVDGGQADIVGGRASVAEAVVPAVEYQPAVVAIPPVALATLDLHHEAERQRGEVVEEQDPLGALAMAVVQDLKLALEAELLIQGSLETVEMVLDEPQLLPEVGIVLGLKLAPAYEDAVVGYLVEGQRDQFCVVHVMFLPRLVAGPSSGRRGSGLIGAA